MPELYYLGKVCQNVGLTAISPVSEIIQTTTDILY
jgi:hypothetical protein